MLSKEQIEQIVQMTSAQMNNCLLYTSGNAFFSVNNLTSILTSMSTVTIFAMAATVSMAPDGFDMSAATLGTFCAYAVSYTHLEVYKRQPSSGTGPFAVFDLLFFHA